MTTTRYSVRARSLIASLAIVAACSGEDGPEDTPGTKVELSYCDNRPNWLAVQDGNGPWTRVLPVAEGKYEATFKSARGGVATVSAGGGTLQVNYGTLTELASIRCDYGYKYVTGTITGVPFPGRARVYLGSTQASVVRDTFKISYVAEGAHDLLATHTTFTEERGFELSQIIIRRDLDPPSNTRIPALAFDSPEAFAPALAGFSVTNQGGGAIVGANAHWLGGGGAQAYIASLDLDGATSGQSPVVPLDRLAAGDLSALGASVSDGPPTGRYSLEYFRGAPDISIEMGPALNVPTATFPAGGSVVQPRVQVASQAEYGRMVFVNFYQTYYASATVAMTAAYLGGTPATWDIALPDLSAAEGWDPSWGLVPSLITDWGLTAQGGPDWWLGDAVHEGDVFRSATYGGSNAPAVRLPSAEGKFEPHRGGFPRAGSTTPAGRP
jgi:hypothetical protein